MSESSQFGENTKIHEGVFKILLNEGDGNT